jgi:histidinol phosphatase-like enzyme
MVLQAALDLDINLSQSYVIGDSEMDLELARQAGCKAGIRVGESGSTNDWVAASFRDAVEQILQFEGHL